MEITFPTTLPWSEDHKKSQSLFGQSKQWTVKPFETQK
jgi:hypothetical protein